MPVRVEIATNINMSNQTQHGTAKRRPCVRRSV